MKLERQTTSPASSTDKLSEIPKKDHGGNRVFEYTGTGSLNITGISSGIRYRFETHGDRIQVAYEDSFSMIGETDLKIVG